MIKIKQPPSDLSLSSLRPTTSRIKEKIKLNNKFLCLKENYNNENINLSNCLSNVETSAETQEKSLAKITIETTKLSTGRRETEKKTSSKCEEKEKDVEKPKIDYGFIFQKIIDYFLAIYNPEEILFRDEEIHSINLFLEKCLSFKSKERSLLISGKPGCGKTLTVTKSIENKIKENENNLFLKINAMAFKNPLEIFEDIKLHVLNKKEKNCKEKMKLIDVLKEQNKYDNIIVMIDEFDSLFKKFSNNLEEILTIFKIANDESCKLILIGVSNSMELIYKIGKKHNKNLEGIENIVFKSYDFTQMIKIIQERIDNFMSVYGFSDKVDTKEILEENALRLCANRIYNLKGGDIRCILEVLMKSFSKQFEKIKNSNFNEKIAISLSDLLDVFEELYNERKVNEIIDSLPVMHQTALLVFYLNLVNSPENNELELNKTLCSFNILCEDFCFPKQNVMGFLQILKFLESYNFISLKQASKFKFGNNNENMIIRIQINLIDIKTTLMSQDSFKNYF